MVRGKDAFGIAVSLFAGANLGSITRWGANRGIMPQLHLSRLPRCVSVLMYIVAPRCIRGVQCMLTIQQSERACVCVR
jgi:hypothetical protein